MHPSMRRIWRKRGVWYVLVIGAFLINLLVAFVTIQGHVSSPIISDGFSDLLGKPSWKQKEKPSMYTESQSWHRMLQENPSCSQGLNSMNSTSSVISSNEGIELAPFGFSSALRAYVEVNTNAAVCTPPPSRPSCEVSQYAAVIFSRGRNLRRLLTHVMAFLAYPSVSGIHLVLEVKEEFLSKDTKYGNRILKWKEHGLVKVFEEPSLWDAIEKLADEDFRSESILWINGDLPKTWNGTVFKSRMRAWRENPDAISLAGFTKRSEIESCRVPLLDGAIMHKSYLCYIKHPVASSLRIHAESFGWDVTTEAIGIYLYYIGHGYVLDRSAISRNNLDVSNKQAPTFDNNGHYEVIERILKYFGCPCFSVYPISPGQLQC